MNKLKAENISIDALVADFKSRDSVSKNAEKFEEKNGLIARWVPKPSKIKYDELQNETNNEFGKFLDEVIIKTIDAVKT